VSEVPTAHQVAMVIVAACRELGEDPLRVAGDAGNSRARHYAMHALVHHFPRIPVGSAARMCGCPEQARGAIFYKSSLNNHVRRGASQWWDEKVYARVVASIDVPRRALPPPEIKPRALLPTLKPSGNTPKQKADLYRMLADAVANTPGARKA